MSKNSASFAETSHAHNKNRLVISVAILFFCLLLAFSLYQWFAQGIRNPVEVFLNLMFIFVLVERIQAKYVCELTKGSIRITKKSLLGNQVHEVDYTDIVGIYKYKTGLVHVIKFRRTYRLNSALDNRIVWVIAYKAPGKGGKPENRRIYFKASDELLDLLDVKMPNRVRLQEETVAINMLKTDTD